jgi:hypothetical protein
MAPDNLQVELADMQSDKGLEERFISVKWVDV